MEERGARFRIGKPTTARRASMIYWGTTTVRYSEGAAGRARAMTIVFMCSPPTLLASYDMARGM